MNRITSILAVSFVLLAVPSWAETIYVGFDDAVGIDYDYQDLVLSISSDSLLLHSTASWHSKPALLSAPAYSIANAGLQNFPYWNQTSADGASENVGFCIYGGGTCDGGIALDSTGNYLSANQTATGSPNYVTFSTAGPVSSSVMLHMAAGSDVIGWYNVSSPGTVNWLNSAAQLMGDATFTPSGNFGLVGKNVSMNETFYSDVSAGGSTDVVSHFAYFGDLSSPPSEIQVVTVTPEPGSILLIAAAFATFGIMLRKRQ